MPATARCAASGAARAGWQRLRAVWFTLVQTSVAAGLAWFLARDVLHHPQPFFAPIAATVSLSISNVLRAQRAVQMMIGVTLGIGVGTVAQALLGPGAVSIAVAALIALCAAVWIGQGYIGQGMMFANQTAVSAILVLALYRSGVGVERIFDALLGGVLAIVVAVLLFPADPLQVLRAARVGVFGILQRVLCRAAEIVAGRAPVPAGWPLSAVDRVHAQLGALLESRATASQIVRIAPRRWHLRDSVAAAESQAVQVALLAGSVLQLARIVAVDGSDERSPGVAQSAIADLAAAVARVDPDPAGACAYAAAARHRVSQLHSAARDRPEVVLADVVAACLHDLQRVLDLRQV